MAYDNVNLWFAKDKNGNIVTIDEVNKELKNTYYCPMCGSELIPRMGDIMSWHFAHVDKSKCDGESMIHFWVKNRLLDIGDIFKIKTDEDLEFKVNEILIEQKYNVDDKIYNPDITVLTECGKTIYFEIANTNKKKIEEYLDIWIELGNIVVEVNSKDLINSQGKSLLEFKALYYNGKCFNTRKGDSYYNIIGKYKEGLKQKGIHKDKKEEIKKLDWFWKDVSRYKLGEVNVEHMANLIYNMGDEEYRIVVDILKKPRCVKLCEAYNNYQATLYPNKFKEYVERIESNYKNLIKIELQQTGLDTKHIEIKSKLRNEEWVNIGYSSGGGFNLRNLRRDIDYIEQQIKCEVDDIEQTKKQNEILNNVNLIEAIEKFNEKYKDTYYSIELKWNGRYNCSTSNQYHIYLIYKYRNSELRNLTIDITNNQISRSEDQIAIYEFIDENLKNYRNSINPVINLNDIENMFITIKNNITKVNPIKEVRRTSRRDRYYYRRFSIYYCNSREDEIYLRIDGIKNWRELTIKGNTLYKNDDVVIEDISEIDITYLKNKMMNIISDEIRKERYNTI